MRPIVQDAELRKRKKGRQICLVGGCRRIARYKKNICCTCQDRRWRANHYIRYLWKTLKGHAKARGIKFSLTRAGFEAFCLRTDYHVKKGLKPDSLTINRIDPERGYTNRNIEVMTHAANSFRNQHFYAAGGDHSPEPRNTPHESELPDF